MIFNRYFLGLFLLAGTSCKALPRSSQTEEKAVRHVLATQAESWNQADLPGYMQGYWQSDSLQFIGKSGVTYGWQQTLDNYRKSYPNPAAMGQLKFIIISCKPLPGNYFYVTGKWALTRNKGDLAGHFTLLFRKIKNEWKIIADHSS